VFVDSDVEVHRGALDRVRAAFAADPELTAIFGSYDDEPAARGLVSRFRNLLHHHVHQQSAGEATTFWAGLGAIRRDAFLAAGGFDARSYRAAMTEDIELGMRMSRAGARIVLDPELRARHLKRWTLASMLYTDLVRRGVPWVRMLLNRREVSPALNLGWRHRVTALAYAGTTAAVVAGLFVAAAALLACALVLNHRLYALLLRRGGPLLGLAGVPLHWLHHLVGVLAVPIGVAAHLAHAVRREVQPPVTPVARVAAADEEGLARAGAVQ
jgi:GT2 family glycosyltransferase